jgi:hypothetical protein
MTERIYPQFIPVDESGNIISSGGGGGDASSANQLLQLTELEEINIDLDSLTSINNKLPALIGGKIPVDIASLNVTVDNANLEISNDTGNPVPVTSAGTIWYSSLGANSSDNIKASAGVIYSFYCTNLNASTRYLWLFNSTGSTAGSPIIAPYPIYATAGYLEVGVNLLGLAGLSFSTGITFGYSTSASTYTAGTASDCFFSARYA